MAEDSAYKRLPDEGEVNDVEKALPTTPATDDTGDGGCEGGA